MKKNIVILALVVLCVIFFVYGLVQNTIAVKAQKEAVVNLKLAEKQQILAVANEKLAKEQEEVYQRALKDCEARDKGKKADR